MTCRCTRGINYLLWRQCNSKEDSHHIEFSKNHTCLQYWVSLQLNVRFLTIHSSGIVVLNHYVTPCLFRGIISCEIYEYIWIKRNIYLSCIYTNCSKCWQINWIKRNGSVIETNCENSRKNRKFFTSNRRRLWTLYGNKLITYCVCILPVQNIIPNTIN